jgi:hypothetical protein
MCNEYQPIEQRLVKLLLSNPIKPEIVLIGTPSGFEVSMVHGQQLFKLYTQRKAPRVFKSPDTAMTYLAELGVDRVVVNGLINWKGIDTN